jgi:hypothetical protein
MAKRQNIKNGIREIPVKEVTEFSLGGDSIRQRIAEKAYDLYQFRGCCHGHDLDDWLEAERMVSAELKVKPA